MQNSVKCRKCLVKVQDGQGFWFAECEHNCGEEIVFCSRHDDFYTYYMNHIKKLCCGCYAFEHEKNPKEYRKELKRNRDIEIQEAKKILEELNHKRAKRVKRDACSMCVMMGTHRRQMRCTECRKAHPGCFCPDKLCEKCKKMWKMDAPLNKDFVREACENCKDMSAEEKGRCCEICFQGSCYCKLDTCEVC
jgi:hypothetical protein